MPSRVSQALSRLLTQFLQYLSGGAEQQNDDRLRPMFVARLLLVSVLFVVAVAGGILTGGWLAKQRGNIEAYRRWDEYVGLGKRSGLTGEVSVRVSPRELQVVSGSPVNVRIALLNDTRRRIMLSKSLAPAPGFWGSQQFPLKVLVTQAEHRVAYIGNSVLLPPHTKRDFFPLAPHQIKTVEVDLRKGPQGGRWDVSTPGKYRFEVWYETYLSGRYIGTRAWTGMTNHAVVEVTVLPAKSGA